MDIDVEVKMYPHNGGAEVLFHEAKSETGSHTFNAKQVNKRVYLNQISLPLTYFS